MFDLLEITRKLRSGITRKKRSPNYSRRSWIIKCLGLYVYSVGLDLTGRKIYSIDIQDIPIHDAFYIYVLALHGLFLGLGFFRLLEIYWSGKDLLSQC